MTVASFRLTRKYNLIIRGFIDIECENCVLVRATIFILA